MSVLVHRCRTCDHLVAWHDTRSRGYTSCPCCLSGSADGDPEPLLQETYTVPGWIAEPLFRPGAPRNSGTMHASTCCDCARCHAAYARLTEVPFTRSRASAPPRRSA